MGRMCGRNLGDGNGGVKTDTHWSTWLKRRLGWLNISSVRLQKLPHTSRTCGRQMGYRNLRVIRGIRQKWNKWKKAVMGRLDIAPRLLPYASSAAEHMCERKKQDGNRTIIRKNRPKSPQIEEIGGRLGRYCIRQLPSASASFRDRLAAAVSLVSDIRMVEGVGKLETGFL